MKTVFLNLLGFIVIGIISMSCSSDLPTAQNSQSTSQITSKTSKSQIIVIAIISMSTTQQPNDKLVGFDVYNNTTGSFIGHCTGTDFEAEFSSVPTSVRVQKGSLIGTGTITSSGVYTIYAPNEPQ